jgi:hypothetical protein
VSESAGGGAIIDAANLVAEQLTSRVVLGKVSWETTARACRARLLFPFANQRGLAQDERALERSTLLPGVCAKVRKHCKGFICLAESHLIGQYDPSLPMDEEAACF